MNCAVKSKIPVVDRKEGVSEIVNAHKRLLAERYSSGYLLKTIGRQVVNNMDYLRNHADLFSVWMKINPFVLLYETTFSSPVSSGYSILLPSILSAEAIILTSIPLGITGKFFKSIYRSYAPGDRFCLDDIISAVGVTSASAETIEKLSLALKRLLYVHAIIIEEAETEKP